MRRRVLYLWLPRLATDRAVAGRPVNANWGARPYSADVPMRPGPVPSAPLNWTPAIGLDDGLRSVLREIDR